MPKHNKNQPSTHRGSAVPSSSLQAAIAQAETFLAQERFQEALNVLKPLVARHPRVANLHALLGRAYVKAGELWNGVAQYEKALSLQRDANLLVSLGTLYLDLDLKVLALQTFRQALRSGAKGSLKDELAESIQSLENEILGVSFLLGLPPDKVAKGLRFLEEGQIALYNHDYARSIHLNRRSTRLLGDFPPPYNNLSLALFFRGKSEEAIHTARQVAERYPDNIQALSNLVRFLAWTGKTEEARRFWEQLKPLAPHELSTRMKKVEAAAIMGEDEEVYRLLQEMDEEGEGDQEFTRREQLYLAIAEANTGRRAAKRRLKALQETIPWAEQILEALEGGQRGLGWAERYPYFHASELLPEKEMQTFVDLLGRGDKMPAAQYRREVARYAARFPQLVLVGKKTLWEDQQTEAAIALLMTLGTSDAYTVLREFGFSQAGDEEARMQALFALLEAGQIPADEPVRFWQDGEWRDIQLRKYEIIEKRNLEYPQQVIDLLNQAILAFNANRLGKAEKLYKRILALEPRAKEAYNNLGSIFARQDKHEQAQAMYQKAIELDPLYVLPRCNLAIYLLGNEKIEEAQAMVAPLVDVTQLHPQEAAFLSYIHARINIENEEYDRARNALEMALQVYPDYKLARDLLESLEDMEYMQKRWAQWQERQHKRDLAKRERQRDQLTTPDPTLAEALGIYTKDILTAIARRVIPWGGWSSLRKADLHQYLVAYLQEPASIVRLLDLLAPEEKAAFERVRGNGGTLAWEVFDQEFGNDMDESPYWQYHEPETVMGRLRAHGLLVEVKVEGELLVSIPVELRK